MTEIEIVSWSRTLFADNSLDGTLLGGRSARLCLEVVLFVACLMRMIVLGIGLLFKEGEDDDGLSVERWGAGWYGRVRSLACWRKD